MDFEDDRASLTRNYMMKLDFKKIIYLKATFHHLPGFKVYDFFKIQEFHILHSAKHPRSTPGHVLNFRNSDLSYTSAEASEKSTVFRTSGLKSDMI